MNKRNVCAKYNITEEELQIGINILSKNLGNICNVNILLAVTELLLHGDIVAES